MYNRSSDITDISDHMLELAGVLESTEEITLGPTDARFAAVALRQYAGWLDDASPESY